MGKLNLAGTRCLFVVDKNKKFKVLLSENIPGHIYKIETFTKDSENQNDIVKETLIYQGIRTNKELREIYNKKKEESKS